MTMGYECWCGAWVHDEKDSENHSDCARKRSLCGCGSGESKFELCDGRGIFCTYVCTECEKEKRAQYRPEVMSDANYECDEDIEPEPSVGGLGLG